MLETVEKEYCVTLFYHLFNCVCIYFMLVIFSCTHVHTGGQIDVVTCYLLLA